MPVTKTASRALRSSKKKALANQVIKSELEASLRVAKRDKKKKDILKAISLTDRATKKSLMHPNKASRIKSSLSGLLSKPKK